MAGRQRPCLWCRRAARCWALTSVPPPGEGVACRQSASQVPRAWSCRCSLSGRWPPRQTRRQTRAFGGASWTCRRPCTQGLWAAGCRSPVWAVAGAAAVTSDTVQCARSVPSCPPVLGEAVHHQHEGLVRLALRGHAVYPAGPRRHGGARWLARSAPAALRQAAGGAAAHLTPLTVTNSCWQGNGSCRSNLSAAQSYGAWVRLQSQGQDERALGTMQADGGHAWAASHAPSPQLSCPSQCPQPCSQGLNRPSQLLLRLLQLLALEGNLVGRGRAACAAAGRCTLTGACTERAVAGRGLAQPLTVVLLVCLWDHCPQQSAIAPGTAGIRVPDGRARGPCQTAVHGLRSCGVGAVQLAAGRDRKVQAIWLRK